MICWMLDADGEPVATDDALVWCLWMESASRFLRRHVQLSEVTL